MNAHDVEITASLVTALLREQHPDLADLPVSLGAIGWDNQLWRLGSELAVRLPWHADDTGELLLKEHALVPSLAAALPLPVPVPQRLGVPTPAYPKNWIVTTWVDGTPADRAPIAAGAAGARSASSLAAFLAALHRPVPATVPLELINGRDTRGHAMAASSEGFAYFLDLIDGRGLLAAGVADALRRIWNDAVAAPAWAGPPLWLHADLHSANVLTAGGALSAVIDFGDLRGGDPAVDVAAGWTLLPTAEDALEFEAAYLGLAAAVAGDSGLHARARGWAALKALVCLEVGDNGDKGLPGGKPTWGPPGHAAIGRLLASA
jgi:aminoglycoside phosphotransferase (APT) family kinase protein